MLTRDRVTSGDGTTRRSHAHTRPTPRTKASARLKGGAGGSFRITAPGTELWNTNFYVKEGLLVEVCRSACVCTRRAWFSLPPSWSACVPKLTRRMGDPPRDGQGVGRPGAAFSLGGLHPRGADGPRNDPKGISTEMLKLLQPSRGRVAWGGRGGCGTGAGELGLSPAWAAAKP